MIQKACAEEVAEILATPAGKDPASLGSYAGARGLTAAEIQKCRITAKEKVLKKLGIKHD